MLEAETRPTGPLRPIEIATASVLALPAVVLTVIGWFLPHLGVVAAFGVLPFGVVAYRHRLRALVASAIAGALLSFLVAGTGTASNIVECAMIGGLIGIARRRRWAFPWVVVGTAAIGAFLAALSIGLLSVFFSLRKLTLEQVRSISTGLRRFLLVLPWKGPADLVHAGANDLVRDWWIAVIVAVVTSTFGYAFLGWFLLRPVINRLRWVESTNQLGRVDSGDPVGPLPAVLHGVSFRYPGTETDALSRVDLEIPASEMVALVGNNGSGKSTLARLLAGQPPTAGSIDRPGSAGLGRRGGTALVMQHPETQVLGVRVADDVVWGLRDSQGVDIEQLLDSVGLAGMGDRETSTLSGGELQRLAVAAALARSPRLLISDESTAMVDEEGRRILVDLLQRLPGERGVGVVHVTHRDEETVAAQMKVRLAGGRLIGNGDDASEGTSIGTSVGTSGGSPDGNHDGDGNADGKPDTTFGGVQRARTRPEPLDLVGVGHTYAVGTPWAQPALFGIDMVVEPNDGLLIVGGNGSGKSTLAWIMAGVLRPTRGQALLGGEPVHRQIGSVGLALQHARLQLQRAQVGADIKAAGAKSDDEVEAALAAVGLPASFADRRIEALSGGQQRRVAIAGILARQPSVLILDEPLAGLDDPTRRGLLDVLTGLRRDHGMTVIIISHDLGGVEQVCDRTIRLESGRVLPEALPRRGAR